MNKSIVYHNTFKKYYKKRIFSDKKLVKRMAERVGMFLADRTNPLLKDHALTGDRNGERSFSITGDIRIIYIETEEYYLFLDIGTHSQVY